MNSIYNDITQCCGCGICMSTCPRNAIIMEEDNNGFVYPVVDESRCINCGLCKKSCAFSLRKYSNASIENCYAAYNNDYDVLSKSSSGGIFSAIAHNFIDNGGVVCGAVMRINEGRAKISHEVICTHEDVKLIQGSKYVQSYLWECYSDIKDYLSQGRNVLFTGTPCQVDAIKHIFHKFTDTNLYTLDIICHGVPSQKLFNDYLSYMSKDTNSNITNFVFRDKRYGWGLDGIITYDNGVEQKVNPENSSYYKYFLDGNIYRENCYVCPYACLDRVGDITIGDYWGVEKYDKQILYENGGSFVKQNGISCMLVNTGRGEALLDKYGNNITKEKINIENVLMINLQLKEPAFRNKKRDELLEIYNSKGYQGLNDHFKNEMKIERIKITIKRMIPKPIKRALKTLIGRN